MWTIWIAIAVVLVVVLISFISFNKPVGVLPPGPKPVPFFGNLIDLIRASYAGEDPFVTLSKWAFTYGDKGLSSMLFADQRVVVVSDAKMAQLMCVKMADNFSCRPAGLFVSRILKGKGIVFNDGPSWKAHRNFVQQEFRKFGLSRRSIEDSILQVADELVQQLQVPSRIPFYLKLPSHLHIGWQKYEGQCHNPHMQLATATYNIIWSVISGTKFQWNDPFLEKLIRNLETNLDAMELVGAHNYVLTLMLVRMIHHNPFKLNVLIIERFRYFRKLISDHEAKELDESSMIADYLERIKHPTGDPESSIHFSKTQLLFLVSDLFIAGGETTVTTLRWAVLCLAIYIPYQDRIRREILDNIGTHGTPSYANRTQFPQLEAFIHEVLRFCTVTPGMWRTTSHDCKVENYDIPKDTWILLHFMAMSKDESTWSQPNLFNPDRFLNDQGQFVKNEHLLVFSAGKRACPGESLARTELFILLAKLVQKYRIRLADGYDWTSLPQGNIGVTLYPPKFQVLFENVDT